MSSTSLPLKFSILVSNSPEEAIALLRIKRKTKFLILRCPHPLPRRSGYIVEQVKTHRSLLEIQNAARGVEYTMEEWHTYKGSRYPADLSELPGLWKNPLDFRFSNLTLVDLPINHAIYWTMPILQAIEPTAPFRRIIIRHCQDWNTFAIPFPFQAFDSHLMHRPAAKVLLAFVGHENDRFPAAWRARLPLLEAAGRIGLLYSWGPNCM
jgi:hypothetical protein